MGKVVIGIIDDGIAISHQRFCLPQGKSRVHYALKQNVNKALNLELTKTQIEGFINDSTHGSNFDDDEFYRRSRWIDMSRPGHKAVTWRIAHGTHVMDLACGYDPAENREDRPIVCVQLPAEVTADTSYAAHSHFALEAIHYILKCADAIAGKPGGLPVVINFSYGAIAGPHDGTSHVEAQIDKIIELRKQKFPRQAVEIVLPAGNSRLSRCHAQMSFASTSAPNNVRELHWRVLPDDYADNRMEIWLPCPTGTQSRLRLTLTSPNGRSLSIDESPGASDHWGSPTSNHAAINYRAPAPGGRGRFLLLLRATASSDRNALMAPAGVWTIRLENRELRPNEVVHAWIERNDTNYGYPLRRRQSYFDEKCYQRYDHGGREIEDDNHPEQGACPVKRASLINSIATGSKPVVIGALLGKEMVAARYSAGGPILARCNGGAPDTYRPDAVTLGEDSCVHRGVLAAGTRSGSVVAMGGTSVAAPQIARWIADQLGAGKSADRVQVQNMAADQEPSGPPRRPPINPAAPNNPRYGGGRAGIPPLPPPPRSILDTQVPRPRFIEP